MGIPRINLAKSAGFCFGVKRALNIALKIPESGRKICMLGDIVHNEEVVRQIEKSGIRKIKRLGSGKGKILLIRAHGSSLEILNKARRLGYNIINATCPMVKEIHKIAQNMEKKGYRIIVIGDKKHDEVQGIVGQLKNEALVIDSPKNIPLKKISGVNKACVVVQSTQNLESVLKIVSSLKTKIGKLKFFNTICMPTRIKQEEIRRLPLENDVVIVIGSKASANTKRLYEISRSLNPRTYWIHTERQIRKDWFGGAKTIGITAGASTPASTTQKIIATIKKIGKAKG